MNRTIATLVMMALGAGCGSEATHLEMPDQDEALAVVRDVFATALPGAALDAPPSIEWSEAVCPRPAADGRMKTAVIDAQGTCYAGLTRDCKVQVAWRGRFSASAFAHELMHCYITRLGLSDPQHDRHPDLWQLAGEADTALAQAGL
jgi:hypothetical protein